MNSKILPSLGKNKRFNEILKSETEDIFSEFFKAAIEKTYQECLEQEISDFLGRDWYQRNDGKSEETPEFRGYRNGYTDKRIKSREGILNIKRPRIRDNEEPFESAILSKLDTLV